MPKEANVGQMGRRLIATMLLSGKEGGHLLGQPKDRSHRAGQAVTCNGICQDG